jgi:hypothetical protein
MNLIIELSPDEERCIEGAKARGVDVKTLFKAMLSGLPDAGTDASPPHKPGANTIALLKQWAAEDYTEDPEELERRDRENAEFTENLRRNRVNFPVPHVS